MAWKFSGFLAMGAALALLPTSQPTAAQMNSSTPVFICGKAILHFTARGFAFECQTKNNTDNPILVVRDANFPGRTDHVIDILRELNTRPASGSGRTRGLKGLWVTYRRPDSPAQAICNAVRPRITSSGSKCFVAGDISFN